MSGIPMQFSKLQRRALPVDARLQPDNSIRLPGESIRRPIFYTLVLATTAAGVGIMFNILAANNLMPLEAVLLFLFSITFGWITISFWSAVCGFVLQITQRDPLSLKKLDLDRYRRQPIVTRTAVVMPVYNEDTHRVIAGFEATLRSLRSEEHTSELQSRENLVCRLL